jgi:APA family basic amino acid/polyamine antiporter
VLSALIAFGVVLSVVGYFAAGMMATPRIVFAFAQQGDFPRWFASIHPRYKTPYVSILVYAVMVWGLAMLGTFSWNVKLSAVSRLITYVLICGALPALRWKRHGFAKFRLPMGPLLALIGIAFCGIVLSRAGRVEVLVLGVTLTIALLNWFLVCPLSGVGVGRATGAIQFLIAPTELDGTALSKSKSEKGLTL